MDWEPGKERIVAVGLLTQRDLDVLGSTFDRAWPINDAPCFEGLLDAIDRAEQSFRESNRNQSASR